MPSKVIPLITSNKNLDNYMANNPNAQKILDKFLSGRLLTLGERNVLHKMGELAVEDAIYDREKQRIHMKKKQKRSK